MSYLKLEEVIKEVTNIPNGQIFRLAYCKSIPLLKKMDDGTTKIFKITSMFCRTGVAYNEIAHVKELNESRTEPKRQYTNNYEYLVKNKIKYNTKTQKHYLQVATLNEGHNTKTEYVVIKGNEINHYNKESFWENFSDIITAADRKPKTESDTQIDVMTINCDNIIQVNNLKIDLDYSKL